MRAPSLPCLFIACALAGCFESANVGDLRCSKNTSCPAGYECVGIQPGLPGVCKPPGDAAKTDAFAVGDGALEAGPAFDLAGSRDIPGGSDGTAPPEKDAGEDTVDAAPPVDSTAANDGPLANLSDAGTPPDSTAPPDAVPAPDTIMDTSSAPDVPVPSTDAMDAASPTLDLAPRVCPGRNCLSFGDNNCNGIADRDEAECALCGQTSPIPCQEYLAKDKIGTCKAGTRTVEMAEDNSECHWGRCEGFQEPTENEQCGPSAPDLNCDGTPGNGKECSAVLHIYRRNVPSYSCGSAGTASSYYEYKASMADALSGWTEYSSFHVFKELTAGTTPVWNCTTPFNYVTISDAGCQGATDAVGYVSRVQAANYETLSRQTVTGYTCSTSTQVVVYFGPGKTSSTATYYAAPPPQDATP